LLAQALENIAIKRSKNSFFMLIWCALYKLVVNIADW
jgi:hypothetical protein